MSGLPFLRCIGHALRFVAGAALLAAWSTLAGAQVAEESTSSGEIVPVVCTSCGSGGGLHCGPGALGSGGCATCCYPGKNYCCDDCGTCKGPVGRLVGGLIHCICCPDPCYEPCWMAVADQGFFLDAARPITHMRLRYTHGWGFTNPDRAEWFFARDRTNPAQLGPGARVAGIGKGPGYIARSVDYQELSLYAEGAQGGFGFFVEQPYRHLEPDSAAISATAGLGGAAVATSGFTDLLLGTKSMLLDCQLTQVTFEFKTWIPTGPSIKGLGTGHVSLEPSILFNLCCSKDTYLQGQFAYWIPIGGDPFYQGDVYHMHFSLNHVLWRPCGQVEVVGNIEVSEYTVCGGAYTDTAILDPRNGPGPVARPADDSWVTAGPGLRVFICDKIDLGVGSAFALSTNHFANQEIRADFRWRY